MSRQSGDERKDGKLVNGFDYDLQVWVQDGHVKPCGHPLSMGANCCNARRWAGWDLEAVKLAGGCGEQA